MEIGFIFRRAVIILALLGIMLRGNLLPGTDKYEGTMFLTDEPGNQLVRPDNKQVDRATGPILSTIVTGQAPTHIVTIPNETSAQFGIPNPLSADNDIVKIKNEGAGGQGIKPIPNMYNGWIQDTVALSGTGQLSAEVQGWISELTTAQKNPAP